MKTKSAQIGLIGNQKLVLTDILKSTFNDETSKTILDISKQRKMTLNELYSQKINVIRKVKSQRNNERN